VGLARNRRAWREAALVYERVLAALDKIPGASADVANITCNLARVAVELHQPGRALPSLERIARTLETLPPPLRASVEFALADARWASGQDRRRALDLARHALAALQQIPGDHHDELSQIERWLAEHRVR
jgi:hypothetical protein